MHWLFVSLLFTPALAHTPLDEAEAQLSAGELDVAQETAEHALEAKGRRKRVLASGLLARVWLAKGAPLEAARVLAPYAKDPRAAVDVAEVRAALTAEAADARMRMDTKRVLAACEATEALGTLPAALRYERGYARLLDGDIAGAATDIEASAAELGPDERPFAAALVSEVRRDLQPDVALEFATEGLVDPGAFETDLHLLRGLAAWEAKELDIARDELAWLHVQRPTAVHATWLGQVELERGEVDVAIPLFEQAVRMNPDRPEGWVGLAGALDATGDDARLPEVRGALRRAAQLSPYDPTILQSLVDVLRDSGEASQAEPLEERIRLLKQP